MSKQWRIKDSNIQSGAVLWLRHSFARAFSGDSLLGDSLPVDCFASLAMTRKYFGGATLVALLLSLRASTTCERGNQQARNPHDSSLAYVCLLRFARNDPMKRHCNEQRASAATNEQQIPKRIPIRSPATRLTPLAMTNAHLPFTFFAHRRYSLWSE